MANGEDIVQKVKIEVHPISERRRHAFRLGRVAVPNEAVFCRCSTTTKCFAPSHRCEVSRVASTCHLGTPRPSPPCARAFESKPKSSTEKISRREFLAAHIEALVLRTGLLERGHRGGRLGHLSATQCAAELTRRTSREVREVPILLQKSFCTGDQKFSGLWTRLLCKDVGDLMA